MHNRGKYSRARDMARVIARVITRVMAAFQLRTQKSHSL